MIAAVTIVDLAYSVAATVLTVAGNIVVELEMAYWAADSIVLAVEDMEHMVAAHILLSVDQILVAVVVANLGLEAAAFVSPSMTTL